MDNVIVRNGKTGLTFEKSSPDESKLKLSNSQITNMGEHLFSARNCKIEVTKTELTNAGGGVVVLIGGNYCFSLDSSGDDFSNVSPVFPFRTMTLSIMLW